ncbi:Lrp/AsnC family transcriptional regulator [Oricola thermophila]|uniref:Lrp/AsnC family transcriptional regulator n=1 Tax=Oricola thermophila TaxID=2742145 RepID=A0A6N1V968_9HYPH|nr:Lrp/AsnC family transcriptional regulator [Oricola thermophila]QKV17541.1 Lrp/AsnC family transcriptional regulator [Oricola thermophila]
MDDTRPEGNRLDRYDRRIIAILESEGRLPVTELARRVGLSKSPCQVRLKRLIEDGYILGFKAVLDMAKMGREHVAFTEVKLSDTTERALADFNAAVKRIPEVEQCHMIAGPFDFLLKVRTRDIAAYRRVLGEAISSLPHVSNTSTYVSMQAVKDGPLPED